MAHLSEGARQLPLSHLSIRIPWHDDGWRGTVCKDPCSNGSCLILPRVRETRDDDKERKVAGKEWRELSPEERPACVNERASVMAPFEFDRVLSHPYAKSSSIHSHFAPTTFRHPAYSAPCIPFRWMLTDGAQEVVERFDLGYVQELEDDAHEGMGFKTHWVQTKRNQLVLLDTFFGAIQPKESLCFLYAKHTPLVEDSRRVIVGVGRVLNVGPAQEYDYNGPGSHRAVLWERSVHHSIRPGFADGFLLPYNEILELSEQDATLNPADYVAFAPEEAWTEFSYASEHVGHDAAISSLLNCAKALRKASAVLPGDWDTPLVWIDAEINRLWKMRGPCPGLGSALTAFGLEHGNLIAHDIASAQLESKSEWNEDPWPLVEEVFQDPDVLQVGHSIGPTLREKWAQLKPERKALLKLLSRFALSAQQATRFYQDTERAKAGVTTTDAELLANPYLLYELDRGRLDAVAVNTVDRGLFPDAVVRSKHPVPEPSALEGGVDPRRVRALLVHLLEQAAGEGHTLQPCSHLIQSVRDLEVQPACPVDADLLAVVQSRFDGVLCEVPMADGTPAYQLARLHDAGRIIRSAVNRRLKGKRHAGEHAWRQLLDAEFDRQTALKGPVSPEEAQLEEDARREKVAALEELYASRISVLMGPAGTGKTTLLKLLCNLPEVRDGVRLLAPTGKARVRMETQTGVSGAQTIAQFLLCLDRYDAHTGAYRLSDRPKAQGVQTLIIDEASMLTEEQLAAVFDAVEPPQRVILVGDPQQLPPIGSGRPFLDVVRRVAPENVGTQFPRVGHGYAELTIRRRQVGEKRDDLLLAEWFSGRSPEPGCDEIWDGLERGYRSEFVRLENWDSEEELRQKLLQCIVEELGLGGTDDQLGFELSLGGSEYNGRAYFRHRWKDRPGAAEKAESWQILSPVRGAGHGVESLNRLLQESFRRQVRQLAENHQRRKRIVPKPMGREGILYGDKVINTRNGNRDRVWPEQGALKYVANGEIGVVVGEFRGKKWRLKRGPAYLEVEFASQLGHKYTYGGRDFSDEGDTVLSLAYALTVHKTQGSEFGVTFVILPSPCRILSRELLYTALTRQKDRVVILYQGEFQSLRTYSDAYYSETARRLTNLFHAPQMVELQDRMFEDGLIHKTRRGEAVRSKSEVIIADLLYSKKLPYQYEREFRGKNGGRRYPDFVIDDAESGETYYWEHLGMLRDPFYRACWKKKLEWYREQGVLPLEEGGGETGTLLVTKDDPKGGIDSAAIEAMIQEVFGV